MERQQDGTKKVLVTSVTHDSGGICILVQQNRSRARTLMHAMTPRTGTHQAQRMLHSMYVEQARLPRKKRRSIRTYVWH